MSRYLVVGTIGTGADAETKGIECQSHGEALRRKAAMDRDGYRDITIEEIPETMPEITAREMCK